MSGPSLGVAIYRCLDGTTDLACIITMVEAENVSAPDLGPQLCCLTVFAPGSQPQFYNRIRYDRNATAATAKPGTCYREA